jgi:excisionase family DNA binding protein
MNNLLSLQTVAELLDINARTACRLIERRELTAVRVGAQWRVSEEALADFIARNTKPAASA